MTPKTETCAVFRRCEGPRPCRCGAPTFLWVVQTSHPHKQGDAVRVAKKDGAATEVILGERLTVLLGDKPVENCFRVAKPRLRAVDATGAAEVAELERLSRL